MRQLFFQQDKKLYFLVCDEQIMCLECCGVVEPSRSVYVHRKSWTSQELFYCHDCFKAEAEAFDSFIVAVVSPIIPLNCVVVPFEMPILVGAVNVWEAAVSNGGIAADVFQVVIKDRTVIARDPFQSVMVAEKPKLLLEEKPVRNEAEAADFLKELQGMQPIDAKFFEALVFREAGVELRLERGEVRKAVLLDRPRLR